MTPDALAARATARPHSTAGRLLLAAGLTFRSGRRLADYPELIIAIEDEFEPLVAALRALVEKWEAGEAPSAFYNEFTQARAALALLDGEKGAAHG